MKKILIFSLVFLCGCAATKNIIYTKNPNCTGVKELEVFQVFEGGALARTTTNSIFDSIVVFLPESDTYKLYDGAKIRRQDNECIVYDGVYKYITASKENPREKTVPIAKFEKRWLDMD